MAVSMMSAVNRRRRQLGNTGTVKGFTKVGVTATIRRVTDMSHTVWYNLKRDGEWVDGDMVFISGLDEITAGRVAKSLKAELQFQFGRSVKVEAWVE